MNKLIVKYNLKMRLKTIGARSLLCTSRSLREYPAVTILLTSINNRYPLELTLRSLSKYTSYPNCRLLVTDNGSTDGSIEMLEALAKEVPLTVIKHGKPRPQSDWYDEMLATVQTPYWIGLHEDMVFVGGDWLCDLIGRMENDPDLYLMECDDFAPQYGMAEPVSGEIIDLEESLATWLFCVRTSLRDRVKTSFAFHIEEPHGHPRKRCYDQGGRLSADMRRQGLRYAYMPRWFKMKWQHLGNLSYGLTLGKDPTYLEFKHYQIEDAKRRVLNGRW